MAHAALKELFPAQVIPFELSAAGGSKDNSSITSSLSENSLAPSKNKASTHALDQSDLVQALEVLAQAALTHRAYEDDVRKLASRVDEMVEKYEAKVKQAEQGQREAEKRAQAAELRAADAERWLRHLYNEIMRLFGTTRA